MREQDLEFNPEYKYAKGGKVLKQISTHKAVRNGDKIDLYLKGTKINGEVYPDEYLRSILYEDREDLDYIFDNYKQENRFNMNELMGFAKGGKTKKFPLAVQRRVDEINEMLPKVNESGDYASTYAGSTMESYIILDKPIQIKGNYVYISEEDSRWGKYGFEKRYNVNDTRDVYESIKGRKALMSDLGIIKRAFTKLLKSEGKMAKGGIAKKSEYISNRDIVSLTHKKGGTKKTLKGSQLVDGAYAKKKIMRKKPTKSDQLSLLNKGGEIVRAYDVNNNSGVGTYAKGGKISKDDAIVKALKMGVDFNKDFHAQSFGGELTELAKETGYRKSKSSSGSTGRAFFEHLEKRYDKNPSSYDDMAKQMARGGKMQGYNAQLDESLAMRKGAKRTKQQSDKDRRDESKAMSKSMDRRAYAGVRGMDKGRRMMAKGGSTMPRLKKGDRVEIVGKRWFQKSYGNTYHTTKVYVNDRFIGETDVYVYGYGDGYLQTGLDILFKHYRPPYKWSQSGAAWTLTNYGIKFKSYVKDVDRQRDLYSVGGKTTMAGDTDFPSELLNYAKGGDVSKIDTIYVEGKYRDDGSDFYENQETNDVGYVVEDFRNDDRGLSVYRVFIRFNDGTEREITKDDFAKGGQINDVSQELYGMNLNEIDGEGIDDVRKLKAIIFELNNRLEEEIGILPFDSEAQGFDKDGNPYGYDNLPFAKGGKMKKPMIRYSGRR